jgi:PAS domain S-box-containing protein
VVDAAVEPVLGRTGSQSGRTRTREVRLRRKDGGVAVCVDTSSGVMEEGRVVRYQGTLVDVTEKRALEHKLRRQEEFRRHLLESFPDLILVLDLKGQYTFVSARIGELLGYGPEHLMGKNVEDAENTSPELAALYRTVATGQSSLTSCEYGSRHQRRQLAHDAGHGQSAARCRRQARGRDHLRPRCHDGEKAGAADYSERTSRRHGADDRRLCARAQ